MHRAFTLIEVLVATALTALMLSLVLYAVGQMSDVWRKSSTKIEAFQSARVAFDLITRNVSQATLNTYLDYDDPTTPRRYLRNSELQFVCLPAGTPLGAGTVPGEKGSGTSVFFQSPASFTADSAEFGGLDQGLNACGYFIEFGPDKGKPAHVTGMDRYRYRLMQLLVPVEKNTIYKLYPPKDAAKSNLYSWFQDFSDSGTTANSYARPVADNIILLLVQPKDPADATLFQAGYEYNSRVGARDTPQDVRANQLPPVMAVTMVAIDETSMLRLIGSTVTAPAVITSALQSPRFTNPTQLSADLKAMGDQLTAAGIVYRVFSTDVPIRESKWTK